MVLGDVCTRGCRFCNIKTAKTGVLVDQQEPKKIAQALQEMKVFDYVVLTSVDRDDLPDQGSEHFAACIREIKQQNPKIRVEVLIPDFQGDISLLKNIVDARPDVIAHNVETVRSLQKTVRDRRANYEQSLSVLENIKKLDPAMITKSAIMLGWGETETEVMQTMHDLRGIDCDILTIGQYLRPSKKHIELKEYVHPDHFAKLEEIGVKLGFKFVASGPFVRSSYKAGELFIKHFLQQRDTKQEVEQHA